jgi:hypothetical protein
MGEDIPNIYIYIHLGVLSLTMPSCIGPYFGNALSYSNIKSQDLRPMGGFIPKMWKEVSK